MAGTTRTRKTAAAKTEPTTAPAPDKPASDADSTPKAPEVAPLEPPTVHEPPEPPRAPAYVTPTEVIPDEENLAEIIINDATKQPPADVDAVFVPLTPYGSTFKCTVRLVEKTFLGPHRSPVHRLLQPAGAHVSESVAARIRARLIAQAERLATQADTTAEK